MQGTGSNPTTTKKKKKKNHKHFGLPRRVCCKKKYHMDLPTKTEI